MHQALEGAGQVIAAASEAGEERSHPLVAFDLLEDSDCELIERYDPEGNLEEAWVSCHVLRWRTDFVAPGTIHPP